MLLERSSEYSTVYGNTVISDQPGAKGIHSAASAASPNSPLPRRSMNWRSPYSTCHLHGRQRSATAPRNRKGKSSGQIMDQNCRILLTGTTCNILDWFKFVRTGDVLPKQSNHEATLSILTRIHRSGVMAGQVPLRGKPLWPSPDLTSSWPWMRLGNGFTTIYCSPKGCELSE